MSKRISAEQAREFLTAVGKQIGTESPATIAVVLGISVATYHAWRSNGMPENKRSILQRKIDAVYATFSNRVVQAASELKDPSRRVWLAVTCIGCKASLEIGCRTDEPHGCAESPMCRLSCGAYLCDSCVIKLRFK